MMMRNVGDIVRCEEGAWSVERVWEEVDTEGKHTWIGISISELMLALSRPLRTFRLRRKASPLSVFASAVPHPGVPEHTH